jgi:hypothetical protein
MLEQKAALTGCKPKIWKPEKFDLTKDIKKFLLAYISKQKKDP